MIQNAKYEPKETTMDTAALRNQMMQLWRDTFHDTEDYVRLIFDNYFDPEWVEYETYQGKVISALLAIPYTFGWMNMELKGIYLCGLSTRENFRNKHYMTEMISRINRKAQDRGYAFSFLIPSDDGLRKYYYDRGYVNASYRIENRYTNIHDFANEYFVILQAEDERVAELKMRLFKSLNTQKLTSNDTDNIAKIIRYILSTELDSSFISLRHSERDIRVIIEENNISGGEIWFTYNKSSEITSVAFVTFNDENTIIIPHLFSTDTASKYKILQDIKTSHPESSVELKDYPEESERKALWGKNVIGERDDTLPGKIVEVERVYKVSLHARPYFMVRILNLDEILKFMCKWRSDSKFSILVKDNTEDKILKFEVTKGEYRRSEVRDNNDGSDKIRSKESGLVISMQQLAEILFRRPSEEHLVMEAFDIPRFVINGSLMLD